MNQYKKICLDPGHGGRDNGASAHSVFEDEQALLFCQRLGHYLRKRGIDVIFTRESDSKTSLYERTRIAKDSGCDLYISVHCNAGPTSANGAEAFVAAPDNHSRRAAQAMLDAIIDVGMRDRGIKPDNASQHKSLYVLRKTFCSMDSVLLELGFLSNDSDRGRIYSKHWRERAACRIAQKLIDK